MTQSEEFLEYVRQARRAELAKVVESSVSLRIEDGNLVATIRVPVGRVTSETSQIIL